MTETVTITCTNNVLYHCWDCKKNCSIMQLLLLPEPLFWIYLNLSYSSNISYMINVGMSLKDATYAQNLRALSLVVARKKMHGSLALLKFD